MLRCPNCNSKIPFWKPWFLTNFNAIECPACGEKLLANKKINSLIGAIGGGTGALTFINLIKSNYSFKAIIIVILWFISSLFVSSLFTKLEIEDK